MDYKQIADLSSEIFDEIQTKYLDKGKVPDVETLQKLLDRFWYFDNTIKLRKVNKTNSKIFVGVRDGKKEKERLGKY